MVPTFLTAEVALAAQKGELARVCKWLNEGGPINARDVFQSSLLHLASAAGQVTIVQELLKRGAKRNVCQEQACCSAVTEHPDVASNKSR